MDLIRTLSERIDFIPYNYEYTFAAPQTDRLLLQDVLISVHGAPSLAHPGGMVGVSCHNIHFYADGRDLTDLFIEQLRANLAMRDENQVKKEYRFALSKWLELEEKMGAAYGNPDLQQEKNRAEQLLAVSPINKNLNQLGDIAAGWGGNLHIFNFLFKEIEVAPVSLADLIRKYNILHPADEIDPVKMRLLTFSSGPCRLYSTQWDPTKPVTGSVFCLFEIKIHNLLEDRVEKLEKDMEVLQTEISEALVNIVDTLQSEVNERLRELKSVVDKTATNLSATQTELQNHQAQLSALKDTTQEILQAIQTI